MYYFSIVVMNNISVYRIWNLDLQQPVQSMPVTTKVVILNPFNGEV